MRLAKWLLLLLTTTATSFAQLGEQATFAEPPSYKTQTLSVLLGAGIPQSRNGITAFWNMGPGGSVRFMVSVSRPVSFGVGFDAAFLKFNEPAFRSAFPAVPVQPENMTITSAYLAMKCSMMPSMRLAPYFGVTLGTTHMSEAIYGDVIDSVRVSYYSIPARTKLTIGLALGADLYIARWLAFEMEAKTNYVHNDPDLGVASFVRGGFRFTL